MKTRWSAGVLFAVCSIFSAQGQFIYREDGTKYPVEVSAAALVLRLKPEVSSISRDEFLSSIPQRDLGLDPRSLQNGFIYVPLKQNSDVLTAMRELRASTHVEHVNPVYMDREGSELIVCDEVVARFNSGVSRRDIEEFAKRHSIEIVKNFGVDPPQFRFRVKPGSQQGVLEVANMFFDSLSCRWAVPNFVVETSFFGDPPNDTYFVRQFYLHSTGQEPIPGEGTASVDADIDALEAWDITKGSSSVVIAVIDQGVAAHEDLPSARIVAGYDFVGSDRSSIQPDSDPSPEGNAAHGMAVAGIIAASHNSIGVAGIAPDCKIMPIKIADKYGNRPLLDVALHAEAIDTARAWGADVINGSWGWYTSDPNNPAYYSVRDAVVDAMTYGRGGKGTVCVFAAGNFNSKTGSYVCLPANVPGVIAVGASEKNNNSWYYSPQSSRLDVVAPSGNTESQVINDILLRGNIWSIDMSSEPGWNPGTYEDPEGDLIKMYYWDSPGGDNYPPGNYTARFGGTSAAAPQVAGIAALMLSANSNLHSTPSDPEVQNVMKLSATNLGPDGFDNDFGWGRANAHQALLFVVPNGTPPSAPTNLTASPYQYGPTYRVKLQWNKPPQVDVKGYDVWRYNTEEPYVGWEKITTVMQPETTFIDLQPVISPYPYQNIYRADYKVQAFDYAQELSQYSNTASIDFKIILERNPIELPTIVEQLPVQFELLPNYPNPFNPETQIRFDLPEPSLVKVTVSDVLGREIVVLINKEYSAGFQRVTWNGTDGVGRRVGSGVYFCRIAATGESGRQFTKVMKMALTK